MKLQVDHTHDVNLSGGKALRVNDGDVEAFLCWGHIPTIRAKGGRIPEQWELAQFMCDLEIYDDGVLVVHKERNFRTARACQAWFRFAARCLAHLPMEAFSVQHRHAWSLT